MAASGYTPISLYYSTTASAVPLAANLANGEVALNTADMKLYAKNSSGVVTLLASNAATTGVSSFQTSLSGLTPSTSTTGAVTLAGTLGTSSGGTNLTSFTANGVVYASSTSALTTSSALTFNGNALSVTGTGGASAINLTDATSHVGFTATPATGGGFYLSNNRVGSSTFFRTSNASGSDTIPMTFLSGGNVGIGTSSPTAKLQVSVDNLSDGILITGNDNNNVKLRMVNSGTGGESWQAQVGAQGASNNAFYFRCNTTSTNVLYLTSSGSVGVIGAASTRNMFQVGSANSTLSGWILGNNSAGNGGIWSTSITPSATNYTLLADGANTTINSTSVTAIATSGTTRFQVGASGQLGIGGATYGTSGQVLTSGGASAAPTWANAATGTVTSITVAAGTGMSGGGTVTTSGTVTLTNAGVTSVTAGTGISVSASTGGVTITSTVAGGSQAFVAFGTTGRA